MTIPAQWHRVSVRQLLLLTAVVALAAGAFEYRIRAQRAVNALQVLGAKVGYRGGGNLDWLEAVFGRATVEQVTDVRCEGERFGDEHVRRLLRLPNLMTLSLAGSRISDQGVAELSELQHLRSSILAERL